MAQGIGKLVFIVGFMVFATHFLLSKKETGELALQNTRRRYGGLFTYLRFEETSPRRPLLWPMVFMLQRLLLSI